MFQTKSGMLKEEQIVNIWIYVYIICICKNNTANQWFTLSVNPNNCW